MFLGKSYEKFASSTELHGFDQVLKYNKFWAAVWLCLTIAACGMCVNDVISLVNTYQLEPKLINLQLLPSTDLDPPNPTLCMEVYVDPPEALMNKEPWVSCPDCDFYVLTDMMNTLYEYNTTAMDTDLESFLTATKNAENLDISYHGNLDLTDSLQYFTYLMLSYLTEAEMTYIGYNNAALTSYVVNDTIVSTSNNTDNFNRQIAHLYQSYMSRIVNFANLKRLIGMSICQQRTDKLRLTLRDANHSITSTICKPRMITHLSFSTVCSKLLENGTDNLANYAKLTLDGTKIMTTQPWSSDQIGTDFTNNMVTFAWHLDFEGRPFVPPNSRQDVASWDPTIATGIDLTIANEFQFYNTKLDPCQSQQWQYDCEWDTRINMMENKCGCRPSSILYRTNSSLPTCSANPNKPAWTVSGFTGICYNKKADRLSSSYCTRDCVDFIFGIDYVSASMFMKPGASYKSTQYFGMVEILLKWGEERQKVTEIPAKGFDSFICDFGGSIGAWLGASLLAFVHAAIHIVLTCYDTGKQLAGLKKAEPTMQKAGT